MTLPRIFTIVQELDRRCREDLFQAFPGDVGKVDYMAILGDNQEIGRASCRERV